MEADYLTGSVFTFSVSTAGAKGYFGYSWSDFEVFRTAGAIHCTDGCEIWSGGRLLHAKLNFFTLSVQGWGVGLQN